uniref:Uncharacterized protein n=1 Tax=Plectus sambesii TaxID=2011161 RepID=A0A914VY09_9BILA
MGVKIVVPFPYPDMEMQAISTAAQLRAICEGGTVGLIEPTEQLLLGKTARPDYFSDQRTLSHKGVRLVAIFYSTGAACRSQTCQAAKSKRVPRRRRDEESRTSFTHLL